MKLNCGIRNLQTIFLVVIVVFFSFFISACKNTRANVLTLDNYSKYIDVTSGTGSGWGGWNSYLPNCNVKIKRASDGSVFQNVVITYKFKIYDAGSTVSAEQEFTESLGDFSSDHTNSFQLKLEHTNGYSPPELFTTVQVLEISGTGTLIAGKALLTYICLSLLIILFLVLVLFFPIRMGIISGKFNKITSGTKYEEVLNILGEPDERSAAEGIITCIWKRTVLRNWTKSYVLTFKDDKIILDMTHSNWS